MLYGRYVGSIPNSLFPCEKVAVFRRSCFALPCLLTDVYMYMYAMYSIHTAVCVVVYMYMYVTCVCCLMLVT